MLEIESFELYPFDGQVKVNMTDVKWHSRFIETAMFVSSWSTCNRRHCGAILVMDKRILATGYNGAPAGCRSCTDGRVCIREQMNVPSGERAELCAAVHAEQNVLMQAARYGVRAEGASMYVAGGSPCSVCAKMMINAGIRRVYFNGNYPDELAIDYLIEANIQVYKVATKEHVPWRYEEHEQSK